jgi:hypothetical protein
MCAGLTSMAAACSNPAALTLNITSGLDISPISGLLAHTRKREHDAFDDSCLGPET